MLKTNSANPWGTRWPAIVFDERERAIAAERGRAIMSSIHLLHDHQSAQSIPARRELTPVTKAQEVLQFSVTSANR